MKQIRNKNRKKTGKKRKPKWRVPSWEHAIFSMFSAAVFGNDAAEKHI